MSDWHNQLNDRLQSSIRRRTYESVQVLVLYWEDGHEGYQKEGQAVREMFQNDFGYPAKEFPLPTTNSYAQLLQLITTSLSDIGKAANEQGASSLLIIHYGGHGDADDDRHEGQERRSVWAAHEVGEPILKWYMIQDQFDEINTSDTDILLLLDCCFAAQAGRARYNSRSRLEIMAASAMGMKTPAPGNTSFTNILIREIRQRVQNDGHVDMNLLHGQMCNRKVDLWATPIYISLKKTKGSVQLHPGFKAATITSTLVQGEASEATFIHLLVQVEQELNSYELDEFCHWLGTDTPHAVSKLVCQTTSKISGAIDDMAKSEKVIFKGLDPPSKEEITKVWDKVVNLVELFQVQQHGPHISQLDAEEKKLRASEFLRKLSLGNNEVLETLERNILCADGMDNQANLEEAIHDDTVNGLGMVEQFRLRQIISTPQSENAGENSPYASLGPPNAIAEYKEYSQYIDKAELPGLTERVKLLANLLTSSKSPDFRSLKCLSWDHQPFEYKYTFQFEVPKTYQSPQCQYRSLHSIIRTAKASTRPTLDERLRIAFLLASALQKWHSVGWLHQGINSHNIIFFRVPGQERFDYREPFLHGFDFARPDLDPSIGKPPDDDTFDIYRHPNRQGPSRRGHRKIHDIYSLGVVMLEIGLWQVASDMRDPRSKRSSKPAELRNLFETASSSRLPHYIGRAYASAVHTCLQSSFGVKMDDERGSFLARAFQSQVIDKLKEGIQPN